MKHDGALGMAEHLSAYKEVVSEFLVLLSSYAWLLSTHAFYPFYPSDSLSHTPG